MLLPFHTPDLIEAGCDEVGRGCIAGPVVAAAVILREDFDNQIIKDSKKLSLSQRIEAEQIIKSEALAWSVSTVNIDIIDRINILQASLLAMHQAIQSLAIVPQTLIIDGNRFNAYPSIPHHCIVKGDSKYYSIAAASILAKVFRDRILTDLDQEYPQYGWKNNKGYLTRAHQENLYAYGVSPHHRKSFEPVKSLIQGLFPTTGWKKD